jgi:tape measure domain-containing protein
MANNETVLKIRAEIENLQGLNQLKTALRKSSAEAKGADNDFRGLIQKVRELQAASVKSINNLNAQRDAFEVLRRSVDVTSKEFKEARDEIEKIDRALKEASGTVVKYSKNSINALRAQKNELLAVRDSADLMSKEFKEAGVELAKLDKKLAKAEGRGSGGRLRAGAQIAGTVAGAGVFGGPEGAIGALGGGLIGGVGGAAIGGALGAQVGQLRKAAGGVAEYVAELNLAKGALGGVSKDIVEYNQNLDFAREISKKYAIRLTDVVKGLTGVTAAAKANNLTVKQTQAIYEGITVSGVAAGKSQEDLQALFLATTQVLSKGKASAEEISGQIGERIPGAVAKFAAANKISLQELAEQFKKGEVTIAKFVRFTEQQGEDYAEVAEALATGPEKAGVRLQIALDEASEAYGGFFLKTGSGIQGLQKKIVDFAINNQETIKGIVADVYIAGQQIVRIFSNVATRLKNILGPISRLISTVVGGGFGAIESVGKRNRELQAGGFNEAQAAAFAKRSATNVTSQFDQLIGSPRYRTAYKEAYNVSVQEALTRGRKALGDSGGGSSNRDSVIKELFGEYTAPAYAKPGQTAPPTGDLNGGDDGDVKASGRSGIDKALRARNAALKLSEILDRQLRDISLKTEGIGASAEQAIENKFAEAFNKAADKTDDLRTKLAKYEAEAGQAFPEITGKINELELALFDAADAQKKLAMQELADKRFGEKLKGYGFTGEALDAGGKIFATGALDQQAFPTNIDSILNPSKITVAIQELKKGLEELTNPVNQVIGAATAIGDAFANSFKSAINGSATAQQALASFFQNIGSYFLDMAAKILAEMIKISILNAVTGLLPGLGSSVGSGFNLGGFGSLSPDAASGTSGFLFGANLSGRANGGPVSANEPYIVGERGVELFVPFQQGTIISNEDLEAQMRDTRSADVAFSSGNRFQQLQSVSLPFTRNAEQSSMVAAERETAQAISNPAPINVRFESQVINGVEYVTAEQHRKGMTQAAERGRAMTLTTLQNSPRTRSKVGI